MPRYNVFQYEISHRMSYLRTLYDHFENFQKKFNGREFPKILWPFASFHTILNLKTVLTSQKIGESKLRVPSGLGHTLVFPIVSLLPLVICLICRKLLSFSLWEIAFAYCRVHNGCIWVNKVCFVCLPTGATYFIFSFPRSLLAVGGNERGVWINM